MDHSNKMRQNLEALELESFDGLSLVQLSDSITKNLPSDTSNKRVLDVYVMWLHHRLMAIDVSAEDDFIHEIATWYRFVKALPNDDGRITNVFHDWQRGQAVENPASSRRLCIAEAELRGLMAAAPKVAESSKIFSKPEGRNSVKSEPRNSGKSEARYGQMHPDRARLSENSPIVIDDDGDDDDIVEISSNAFNKCRASPRGVGQNGQSDLSFLTGSNMLPMNGKTRFSRGKEDIDAPKPEGKHAPKPEGKSAPKPDGKPMPKPEGKLVAKPSDSHSAPSGKKGAGVPKKPPGGYVCDRCKKKGHFFKDCPTSMDPAFDRKPPKAYTCHICKKKGEHHVTLCPMNDDPLSLTQRRRGYEKKHGLAGENRHVENGDGYRDDRQTRGRDRSRSPCRDAGRRVHTDRYRPLDEFSRLRESADRDQPRKRRASPSRSPSLDRIAPRKKSQRWVSEDAKNWSTMTFADDLMTRRRDPAEGRLSYDDVPQPSPTKHSASSSVIEDMDVEVPERAVSEKRENDPGANYNQLLELDILEMIRVESVKTDLLLLVGGVERHPLSVPFLDKFFKGQETVWVNEALIKTRPCSTDFYSLRVEDEQLVETSDCEMVAEVEAAEGVEQLCASASEEDSEMLTLQPARSATGDEGDAVMADAEPTGAVSDDEENMAFSIIPKSSDDEKDIVVNLPVSYSGTVIHGATNAEGTESSFPHIDDDTAMEVEAAPATAEDSPAASDSPLDPVGCGVDSEMADAEPSHVTEGTTAGCQNGYQEIIIIESSQPTEPSQPDQAGVAAGPSQVVEE